MINFPITCIELNFPPLYATVVYSMPTCQLLFTLSIVLHPSPTPSVPQHPPFPRASQGTEGRQDGFWGILLGERARCIKVCSGNANLKWLWTCPHTPPPTISHLKNLVKIPQLNAIQHKCSLIPNLQ